MNENKSCITCKYSKRKSYIEPCSSCIELREELEDPPMWTPKRSKKDIKGYIGVILVILAIVFNTWLMTIGAVGFICWCFGIEFNWMVTSSIWLFVCSMVLLFTWDTKNDQEVYIYEESYCRYDFEMYRYH